MTGLAVQAIGALQQVALLGRSVLLQAQAPDGFVPYAAENEWSYVLVGWAAIILGIAAYAVAVVRKGRQLAKQLPPDERRWTS